MLTVSKLILWGVALFYAYGAIVHLMNIAGFSGFDWLRAPLKWQILDIVYLVLDIIVAAGLLLGWRSGLFAFYIAAISQIILYTAFRQWILDVPQEFVRSPQEISYLGGLVVFHVITLVLVSFALWVIYMR